jgi:quercetin dioxygenase-like cupin family protein
MKNIRDLHSQEKPVSAISLFKGELGTTTAIQLEKNASLAKHLTKTPALLLCVSGSVTYGEENCSETTLMSGDYVLISPNVPHWVSAIEKSQLVLLK